MTLFGGFTPPAAMANLRGVFHGIYCYAKKSAEKRREIKKLLIFVTTKKQNKSNL